VKTLHVAPTKFIRKLVAASLSAAVANGEGVLVVEFSLFVGCKISYY
jgi:hypothetical protein